MAVMEVLIFVYPSWRDLITIITHHGFPLQYKVPTYVTHISSSCLPTERVPLWTSLNEVVVLDSIYCSLVPLLR
jgi:hypothetical protein